MGRKDIFSNDTSNSSGVAILLPSNIDFELCEKKMWQWEQTATLKIKFQSNTYVLCNIYAPTQDHKLDQNNKLAPFATENILLGGGGNFNLYMNLKLDKMDNTWWIDKTTQYIENKSSP